MSTYQGIRGLKVRDYTTNPDDPLEGQLWYNTTDNVAKYQIPSVLASWATAASMNTARKNTSIIIKIRWSMLPPLALYLTSQQVEYF